MSSNKGKFQKIQTAVAKNEALKMAELRKRKWNPRCYLVAGEFSIRWQQLISFIIMYIVQLYKEDWAILHMLGCQAIALPCTEQIVIFWGLCRDTVTISVSLLCDKYIEIQLLAHALLQRQPVTVHQVMSF